MAATYRDQIPLASLAALDRMSLTICVTWLLKMTTREMSTTNNSTKITETRIESGF